MLAKPTEGNLSSPDPKEWWSRPKKTPSGSILCSIALHLFEISFNCIICYIDGRVDLHSAMMETSTNRDGHWEKERPGPGGRSSPSWCTARQRVAVIVPYRNRPFHLEIFLRVIHPFLQRQLLNYTIFIVEQVRRCLSITLMYVVSLTLTSNNTCRWRHSVTLCMHTVS